MRRAAHVVVAIAGVLALAACGVQEDSDPRPMAADEIPFGLLAPATSVSMPENDEGTEVTVWLVDNAGLLSRARRPVEPPIGPTDVIEALLAGVTDAEADAGLRTNIPPGTELLGVDGPNEGLVTIDLSGEFLTVERELQRLALAQVVFTVTGLANVDRVLFEFDGEPAEVPGRNDELTSEPLRRADFEQFDPRATTTTVQP